jgi:hypothetical protein
VTWLSWHSKSEALASEAHVKLRYGDRMAALQLFLEAAQAETEALKILDKSKTRTLGITAVSAVALWFKGGDQVAAERLACEWLSTKLLPDFAVEELRHLLQSIWTASSMQNAGVSFLPGRVMVSVQGPKTIAGGAPLDLILQKVQIIQSIVYRTIEYVKDIPHRRSGQPSLEVQEACRPWLLQAPRGSYQFEVAVQEPEQKDFFKEAGPNADQIAGQFMSILSASVNDPTEELPKLVKSEDYQKTFLKLTRNLAPTGKNFSRIEISGPDNEQFVSLVPENRKMIRSVLNEMTGQIELSSEKPISLCGTLRALHLDEDWLELLVEGVKRRVDRLPDAVDEIIGPMVNREVVVQAVEDAKGRARFVDIETTD